MKYLLQTGRPK